MGSHLFPKFSMRSPGVLCGVLFIEFFMGPSTVRPSHTQKWMLLFVVRKGTNETIPHLPQADWVRIPFCRSSSLSPYRQNRLLHVRGSYWHPMDPAPNFLFMGMWGGVGWGGFINFYVYPVRRGCQELTRWFPQSRLSLSTLHLSILRHLELEDLNTISTRIFTFSSEVS
jgi:hypothetical protein